MKKRFLYIATVFLLLAAASCSKDADDTIPDELYGTWKITNSDTLILFQNNGMNIANCDLEYAGPVRKRKDHAFTYRNGQLGIKGWFRSDINGGDFYFFDSFRWIQRGQSFEILTHEWFPLSSTLGDYYTFTKIP